MSKGEIYTKKHNKKDEMMEYGMMKPKKKAKSKKLVKKAMK